jgi:hypothetical protein
VVRKAPILGNTDELSRTAGSAAEFLFLMSSPIELEVLGLDLRRSGLPRLKRSESQHREPVRVVPPRHQLTRTPALTLGPTAAHEAPMIQEEAQQAR